MSWLRAEELPATFGPIVISPGSHTWHDLAARQHAWAERVLLQPMRLRTAGQPWQEAACQFAARAVDYLPTLRSDEPYEVLYEEGHQVEKAGCQDPLFLYLLGRIEWQGWPQFLKGQTHIKKAADGAATLPEGAAILWCAQRDLCVAHGVTHPRTAPEVQAVAQSMEKVLTDGTYQPDEDNLFYQHFTSGSGADVSIRGDVLLPVLGRVKISPWLQNMLLAHFKSEQFWASGAHEPAAARRYYLEAWRLRPDRPEAAAILVHESETYRESREWFDRAVALEFDAQLAYRFMAERLAAVGPEAAALLLSFGEACRVTKRYDTDVPMYFTMVLRSLAGQASDWRAVYRQPDLAKKQVELSRAIYDDPTRKDDRIRNLESYAVNALLCGDFPLAARLRRQSPGVWQPSAQEKLREFGIGSFDAALAAGQFQGGGELSRAEGVRPASRMDRTEAGLLVGLDREVPILLAFMEPKKTRAAFLQKFASQQWISVEPGYDNPNWFGATADPKRPPQLEPLTEEQKKEHWHAVHAYPLGEAFAMRAEFGQAPAPAGTLLAALFAGERTAAELPPYPPATETIRVELHAGLDGKGIVQLKRAAAPVAFQEVSVSLQVSNTVELQVQAGKVSVTFNGQTIVEEVAFQAGTRPSSPETVVGFDRPPHTILAPTKVELRKLPEAVPPAPNAT